VIRKIVVGSLPFLFFSILFFLVNSKNLFSAEGLSSKAPNSVAFQVTASGSKIPREVGEPQQTTKDETERWLNPERINVLFFVSLLLVVIAYYFFSAHSGGKMYIRRIPGLCAIDEAIGRAAEIGKPILFIPGILDMTDIQTVAGVNILGHIAEKVAALDSRLICPMARPFAMSVAQEVVKNSFLQAGKPDRYRTESVFYLTYDQLGFVAGVTGIMAREVPATCFYLGAFKAESLILAETGNHLGALQIAGTAEVSQIPFFIVTCDYTLIGEELFAASAYLTRNPQDVASLKGQDAIKLFIIMLIVLGSLLATISQPGSGLASEAVDLTAKKFMRFFQSD